MSEIINSMFESKSIALLGFGREGRSTYAFLRKIFPSKPLTIIDENENIGNEEILKLDSNIQFITGNGCMESIDEFDIAVKSPGIASNTLPADPQKVKITSQTDIFLQLYGKQVIGITGTKGKSTTSSLIYHILKNAGFNALLVGNIGVPPFDCLDEISPESVIVMELSSHQLEYVNHSPHIAVLLNIYQEHLDHYHSYKAYQLAKINIGRFQEQGDYFIFNFDNEALKELVLTSQIPEINKLPFSVEPGAPTVIHLSDQFIEFEKGTGPVILYNTLQGQPLQGHHNLSNIMAASAACHLKGVSNELISSGIRSFKGLEHRIEPVGEYAGIFWYNDSIATIPEATIEAVKTLKSVDTLILGGFDRGIGYDILYPFLSDSEIRNIIFVGEAGKRMKKEFTEFGLNNIQIFTADNYNDVITIARRVTLKGKICLLSPAAASYDMFRNFEERGFIFKKNVRELKPSQN
jgi:UDP-N-acetylmuramoyl-L-alanine---L-glutamate ligase